MRFCIAVVIQAFTFFRLVYDGVLMTARELAEDFKRDLPTCHPSVRQVYQELIAFYTRRAQLLGERR